MLQVHNHGKKGDDPPKPHHSILIALGGNLASPEGPPQITLRKALKALVKRGAVIRALSEFYHTPAFPEGNGPDYVNVLYNAVSQSLTGPFRFVCLTDSVDGLH